MAIGTRLLLLLDRLLWLLRRRRSLTRIAISIIVIIIIERRRLGHGRCARYIRVSRRYERRIRAASNYRRIGHKLHSSCVYPLLDYLLVNKRILSISSYKQLVENQYKNNITKCLTILVKQLTKLISTESNRI